MVIYKLLKETHMKPDDCQFNSHSRCAREKDRQNEHSMTNTQHNGQWNITNITRDRQVRDDRQVSNINACKPQDAVSLRICNCDGQ